MYIDKIVKKIDELQKDNTKILAEFDAMGLLLAPEENFTSYKNRIKKLFNRLVTLEKELKENNKLSLFGTIVLYNDRRIGLDIMQEASKLNKKFYGFEINWVPGFFLSKSLGMLWGGCAVSFPEDSLSIFLIRANFAKKQKWLFYRRDELLAHELCHIARMPLRDRSFEEHFAYRLSHSRFRRYIGNCFQHTYDAIYFLIPFFLLVGAQAVNTFVAEWFPIYPFWILAILYPAFLFIRNQISRNKFFIAKSNLENIQIKNPLPILFRCTKNEIYTISAFRKDLLGLKEWIEQQSRTELRWEIIVKRFVLNSDPVD